MRDLIRPTLLRDKVILVTGGARGLGAATCRLLAEEDAIIVVADINKPLSDVLAHEIQLEGKRAISVFIDVRHGGTVESAVEDVFRRFSRIDVLVNNAGIDVTLPFSALSIDQWDDIIGINLRGAFLTARAVFPSMQARATGHIINIVSTASKRTWANAAAYHAAKWGLLGFSHALHVEGRPHNIKVTAIVAGGMRTPFLYDRFPNLDPSTLQDPANVANAIRFALMQPTETVIPELMVLPHNESSWP